jgi:hypothetical protein
MTELSSTRTCSKPGYSAFSRIDTRDRRMHSINS